MPVREQTVTLPEELQGEVLVTPTPQLPRVQVPAAAVSIFRLGSSEYVRLILRLENEKPPPILLQELHRPFPTFMEIFGDVHGRVLLGTLAEFTTTEQCGP